MHGLHGSTLKRERLGTVRKVQCLNLAINEKGRADSKARSFAFILAAFEAVTLRAKEIEMNRNLQAKHERAKRQKIEWAQGQVARNFPVNEKAIAERRELRARLLAHI